MGATSRATWANWALPRLFLVYAAVSLLHFAHNAAYLASYPNLPASWSAEDVYLAWCGITGLGALGLLMWQRGRRKGLALLAAYAGLGYLGLAHYARAPFLEHTSAMNVTIWAEVAAATLLLIDVVWVARKGGHPGQA